MGQLAFAECVLRGADRSHVKIHCALGHSFLPIQVASSQVAESHLEMTMAALLIGYAVLFRSPANLNQSTNGGKNGKSRSTGETDGLSIVGLLRAYRRRSLGFHVYLVDTKPIGR